MTDMIESGPDFLAAWEKNRAILRHTYDPAQEHDACGVGLVAAIDGKPRRDVVQAGIDALKAVWHRGAVDADGKTGDGAGIHVEIPQDFFADADASAAAHKLRPAADRGRPGVPAAHRPRRAGALPARSSRPRSCAFGYPIYGWRQVPVNVECIGEKANATRPEIEQIMICERRRAPTRTTFERDLYVIRRRIEKQAIAAQIPELYVCSLSCRSIIYKGMFLAEQPDATSIPTCSTRASSRASRSTTSAIRPTPSRTWRLAQPFRDAGA